MSLCILFTPQIGLGEAPTSDSVNSKRMGDCYRLYAKCFDHKVWLCMHNYASAKVTAENK